MQNNENIKLTAKQEQFCYEYCIDFNATQAAIRAGYSDSTAGQIGFENLKKPEIQKRISKLQTNLSQTSGISALRIAKEHEKIAFSSIAHLHNTWIERVELEKLTDEQKACIKSISTKVDRRVSDDEIIEIEFVKIELYDKQKSLDSLSKMFGFDAPTKLDVDASISVKPMTKDFAKKIIDELGE